MRDPILAGFLAVSLLCPSLDGARPVLGEYSAAGRLGTPPIVLRRHPVA